MAGTPREHVTDQGFWDGGAPASGKNGETAGRASGYPGVRKPTRVGIRTDIEFPEETKAQKSPLTQPSPPHAGERAG